MVELLTRTGKGDAPVNDMNGATGVSGVIGVKSALSTEPCDAAPLHVGYMAADGALS